MAITSLDTQRTAIESPAARTRDSERGLGLRAARVEDRLEISARTAISGKSPSMAQLPNVTGRTPRVVPTSATLSPPSTEGVSTASFGGTVSLLDQRAVQTARMPNIDITFGGPGPSGAGTAISRPDSAPAPTVPGRGTGKAEALPVPGQGAFSLAGPAKGQENQTAPTYGPQSGKAGGTAGPAARQGSGRFVNFLA